MHTSTSKKREMSTHKHLSSTTLITDRIPFCDNFGVGTPARDPSPRNKGPSGTWDSWAASRTYIYVPSHIRYASHIYYIIPYCRPHLSFEILTYRKRAYSHTYADGAGVVVIVIAVVDVVVVVGRSRSGGHSSLSLTHSFTLILTPVLFIQRERGEGRVFFLRGRDDEVDLVFCHGCCFCWMYVRVGFFFWVSE